MEDDDKLDRRAVDEWQELRATAAFSDRVMQRITPATPAPRRRPWLWSLGGATLGVAATLAVMLALQPAAPRTPQPVTEHGQGEATTERLTARAGDRATIVLEPGARIEWLHQPGQPFIVDQPAGDAFYRVDRGDGPFRVRTPQGEVEVLGTCFTLRVSRTRTEVFTHEGVVRVGGTHVRAGERVELTARGVATVADPAPAPAVGSAHAAVTTPEACDCDVGPPLFEPSAAVLRRWAAECRVRTDLPPLGYDETYLEQFLDKLGLGGADAIAAREALAVVEQAADAELRRLYTDATGDSAADVDAPEMYGAIAASADKREHAEVRRRLSAERAGLAAPPADGAAMTPYEEMVRGTIATGDAFEAELGRRLGPGRARDLRRRHGGWPTMPWHDAGCPTEN